MIIKTLMKSIRQHKKETILASVFAVIEVVLEVMIPFFTASLIDKGIAGGNMDYITKMGIMLICFALLSLTFGALSGSTAALASSGFAANLRHDIFCGIQKFSFSNIDRFSSASLVTRLTTDVTNVMMAYQAVMRQGVRAVCMIVFALSLAFTVNSKLALIFVFAVPVLGFILFWIAKTAHPFFLKALKTYDKLNIVVQENLLGIRVVKSYVREEEEDKKFRSISSEIYKHFTGGQKRVAYNNPAIQFFTYACMLLVSWIGANLIVSDAMTTGNLMSMFAYVMQILMNLMMLSVVFVQIIIARSSAQRIVDVLREQPEIISPKNPVTHVEDGSIEFRNVGFSYVGDTKKTCLNGADFRIYSGETIGIIGATGSSKTSLIQLIPRLYDATAGSVLVGDVDVRRYEIKALRDEVAMVPQNSLLFSGTILENLRWGNPGATEEEICHACRLAQAEDFIKGFRNGYETYIEEGGTNVSGGQRQRLCIARALVKNPKILILDDATSAVDTKTDAMIRKAFRQEIPNTTKLIVAQRISSVEDADRIIVLEDGTINAIGTHTDLLKTNHIYQEVYNTQMQGGGDFDEN